MAEIETIRQESVKTAIEIAIKLGILVLILFVSFLIVKPFLPIILWSVILAVAFFPLVESFSHMFHSSKKKVVIVLVLVFSTALLVPTYFISDKAIDSVSQLTHVARKGNVSVPSPPENLKEWPLVGESLYTGWESASQNLGATLKTFEPQIKVIASKTVALLGDALRMILFSIISVLIAAYLITQDKKYAQVYTKISTRLIGEKGQEWAKLTVLTIRSVASGVIGVAVIQSFLALVGLVVMDIPFSVVIALGVMFLTIMQLPTIILIGPVVALVLSQDTSTSAIVFSIYMLIVGAIDGVLRPFLMGRGVDIPMVVVLVGAIGGMLLMGMIGLFVGAVIFALAYKLFMLWLSEDN